ncbi:MAG: hypothetical protein M3069_02805 [Chloroflexota bacterium]|nr:hypothetical protein [Chloroflexota bacterium]
MLSVFAASSKAVGVGWAIVAAKSLVVATSCSAISAWVVTRGFGIGLRVGPPGWSADGSVHAIGTTIALAAVLTTVRQTTTAFFAGVGRVYILPLAGALLTIFVAQVVAVLGWVRGSRGPCLR